MSLADIKHPILYSTMSLVAFNINNLYYKSLHYLWCTPYFSSDYQSPHYTVPPSSSPFEIYKQYRDEIQSADKHGYKISQSRLGLKNGAHSMRARGSITESQLNEILFVVDDVDKSQFRPLLCVISRLEAVPHYQKVPINEKANPLAHEYIVADLPQSAFDIISVG